MFAVNVFTSGSEKLTRRKEFRLREVDCIRIKAAADAVGLQESDFIREAAIRHAEDVERRMMVTVLAQPAFDAFREALDAPAVALPGLAAAARQSENVLTRA